MRPTARAAVCGLTMLLGIVARADPGDQNDIKIQAERGEATGLTESDSVTFKAEGDVHVSAGGLKLRAPTLMMTKSPRQAILEGGVVGLRGHTVLTAQQLIFDVDTRSLALTDGQISMKARVSGEELQQLFDSPHPERVCKAGVEALTLRASRLAQPEGSNTFYADDVFFTTCACPDGCRPMLSFTAKSIAVTPGESASMTWPVFRLFSVPVFALPWVSIPLSDRKTGILFPVFSNTGPGGIQIGLPLYVTLGRSADLTLTPRYAFGTQNSDKGGTGADSIASRGPAAELEVRWRPSEAAIGQFSGSYLYDTSLRFPSPQTEKRGSRGAATLVHRQPLLSGNASLAVDVVSDARYLLDTVVPLPRRNQNYLRSDAAFAWNLGLTGFSLDTNYIQDLNPVQVPNPSDVNGAPLSVYPRTRFNELPGVIAPLGRLIVGRVWGLGPVVATGRLDLSQEGTYPGMEVNDGHIRRFIAGGRLTQTVPILAGHYGTVSFESSERAQFVSAGETPEPGWRAGGYVDLLAQSQVQRAYANNWVHAIRPSFRIRALGVVQNLGSAASVPFSNGLFQPSGFNSKISDPSPRILQSELDMALPEFGTIQTITRVETTMAAPKRAALNFAVEYHAALNTSSSATNLFDPGFIRANASVSYERWLLAVDGAYQLGENRRPTTSGASLSTPVPIGTSSVSGYFRYINGPTDDLIARGLDVLFAPRSELPSQGFPNAPPPQYQFGGALNISYEKWRFMVSAGLVKPVTAAGATQDYMAMIAYETESCGRLSLSLRWNHQPGSAFTPPIPLPNYEFNNVQSALATGVGLASPNSGH